MQFVFWAAHLVFSLTLCVVDSVTLLVVHCLARVFILRPEINQLIQTLNQAIRY